VSGILKPTWIGSAADACFSGTTKLSSARPKLAIQDLNFDMYFLPRAYYLDVDFLCEAKQI
jgi:hypothetical protein